MNGNLTRARSSIIFILAVLTAFWLVVKIEQASDRAMAEARAARPADAGVPPGTAAQEAQAQIARSQDLPAPRAARPLTDQEREWARIAWQYIENNTQPKTGLVNSVDKYPAATLWDTASYLLGLIAARRIELIDGKEFDRRMARALASLSDMPLFDNALPNKSYSTETLAMVDYAGKPAEQGIGWSAIDLARLMVPLSIVVWNHPDHAAAAQKVIARWDLSRLTANGQLFGAEVAEGGRVNIVQEGRLGYEQYAAKAVGLLGLDVAVALDARRQLQYAEVYGLQIPHDRRDPARFGAHNFILSEPYMLDGLEFGWDAVSREFAWRIYRAQEERFKRTGVLTAVTEDHVDQAPYFVYNSVYADGKAWNAITEKGEDAARLRSLSVKAAFAWHALYGTEYTQRLIDTVAALNDPARGWYAGLYEEGGKPNQALTVNTNSIVLESLAYIATGKMLSYR